MLMAVTTVLAGLVALHWGFSPLIVAAVNGFFLIVDLVFVGANAIKLVEGGWFLLLLAGVVAFLMLTGRTGYLLLEGQRSRLRQRKDDFIGWVLANPPIRLPGAAAIFSAASSGIPLALTHHLRHNRVLHERVLLINIVSSDAPRINPDERVRFVPVGAGITRIILQFGFMEHANVMDGLKLACRDPSLRDIDPEEIAYYFRRVMVIPKRQSAGDGRVAGAAVPCNAPQRQSPRRLFRGADSPGRRGRSRGRDLNWSQQG